MYNATEQFADFNKVNVANATKLAALSIENAEKLFKLNLNAARIALQQSVEGAQAAASVKDVQELMAIRTKFAESGVQTALSYSRTLYDLASEAQAEYSSMAEELWANYTKGVAAFVDKASKSAPAGSDAAVNAFKSTFAASTAAFDQFQCILRPVGTFDKSDNVTGILEKRQDMTTASQGNQTDGNGFNPPSLFGTALGAPYLHGGQAATLESLFSTTFAAHYQALAPNFLADADPAVRAQKVDQLVQYLLSIDEGTATLGIPNAGAGGGNFCAP